MENSLNLEEKDALFSFFPRGLVAVDLETTGLSPFQDRIIEIGAVKIDHTEELSKFGELIDPEAPIPPNTIKIHHITDEMVKGRPKIHQVLPSFLNFCGTLPVLAHNAAFDLGFIIFNINKMQLPLPDWDVFDSCKLSRKMYKELSNHRLSSLAKHLNIINQNQHRAFDDALTAFLVFTKQLKTARDRKLSLELVHRQAGLFKLAEFRKRSAETLPEHLNPLIERIGKNEILEISYNGGSKRNQFRPVRPVSFLPMPKGAVLHALCILSGNYKSFAVSKIQGIKILDEQSRKYWEQELEKIRPTKVEVSSEDIVVEE